MAKLNCLNPIKAFIQHYYLRGVRRDKIKIFKAQDYLQKRKPDVLIPCRECKACKLNERNRWASRIIQMAQKRKPSYFITLTYKDNPKKLFYKDVQLFFKKLRKKGKDFKYFVVGEYGEKKGRPHWHVITHGLTIDDLKLWKLGTNGGYYLSKELEEIWEHGFILITEFSEATAKYVAGYTLKKYDEELIFKVSKGYGMFDDERKALETFTKGNGAGLTQYEKQKLRKKYGNLYYEYADKIRREQEIKEEETYKKKSRQAEINKIYDRITRKQKKGNPYYPH